MPWRGNQTPPWHGQESTHKLAIMGKRLLWSQHRMPSNTRANWQRQRRGIEVGCERGCLVPLVLDLDKVDEHRDNEGEKGVTGGRSARKKLVVVVVSLRQIVCDVDKCKIQIRPYCSSTHSIGIGHFGLC